jgi:FAD synthase
VEIGTLVRGQRSFESEEELVEQIASDVEAVRALHG